jgi:hypothetical protein
MIGAGGATQADRRIEKWRERIKNIKPSLNAFNLFISGPLKIFNKGEKHYGHGK